MYHCHICFYLTGQQQEVFEIIKNMPPMKNFTHEFMESASPESTLAAKADVIIADLRDMDAEDTLGILLTGKRTDAELILLAKGEQTALLTDKFSEIKDIWPVSMSAEEVHFRFLRWQQTCKMSKDYWQTSNYLETTINNVPNLIWYKDKEGIHVKVNDCFCETVGKSKQQVEGQDHFYIWDVDPNDPANNAADCMESDWEVMNSRKTCVSEELVNAGENVKLLKTYKSPLYDLDGSVMGTAGVAIDITQERAYANEIMRKNRTLETLFTTMDCGIMSHSLDGSRVISVNKAALDILGYETKEELTEKGFDMIAASVMDEDRPKLRESIRSLTKEGDSTDIEYRVRHKDGEILYVMGNTRLICENGELIYQRFLLDCTVQKLREKKERLESERRQTELIQALSINYNLVCFFDLDTKAGAVVQIDDKDECMFGSFFTPEISPREGLELYIREFVYKEDQEMLLTASSLDNIRKQLETKQLFYTNYRTLKDGNMKYFQMKVVRAGTWEENHGIVLGLRNVDEETRNEMKNKILLEDALQQANKANRAKSNFLSNMSHDIRTPMNAIVGFTGLAITHINNQDQVKEYLQKIMTSGNHLLSLINDVLDMSRIESGKMRLNETDCSLPDTLHSLRNIIQADIHAKQLEFYIDAVNIVNEKIYCDKLRLNQLLLNLLSNSVKYTPAGGTVSMRVTEKPEAPAGYAAYQFDIRDTGIGMSEEFLKNIFEPFERENTSTISGIQGTGLGMAITKNIVDMMNGTIEVKSRKNSGTEFIVNLTFRLCSSEKEPVIIPKLKNCRALVVDDDFTTCDSVSYMLQQIGMRAEWTLSGREAILRTHQALTRNDNYCVYIIDWLLPDINGIEITRRIRKESGGDVPIIILTAYDWSDIEEDAKEAGVTAFCSKPLFMSELRQCLHSVIDMGNTEETKNEEAVKIRNGHILLAEDNELNQEIASTILTEAGFTVDIADNGQIALNMLKNSQPGYYQLILMDVQMPVMNGYEATKAIRCLENTELAEVPILAMTANAFEEDKQEAMRCGMNGHITKPIDIDILFDTLDKTLG